MVLTYRVQNTEYCSHCMYRVLVTGCNIQGVHGGDCVCRVLTYRCNIQGAHCDDCI